MFEFALPNQLPQCVVDGCKSRDLFYDYMKFFKRQVMRNHARLRAVQLQQTSNIVKIEAKRLRPLDKADAARVVVRVFPIARQRPFRLRQQTRAVIKPDGLDAHARRFRQLSDGQSGFQA